MVITAGLLVAALASAGTARTAIVWNAYVDVDAWTRRKIREAILAYKIEKYLTKEEILFLYLNQIYLGHVVVPDVSSKA